MGICAVAYIILAFGLATQVIAQRMRQTGGMGGGTQGNAGGGAEGDYQAQMANYWYELGNFWSDLGEWWSDMSERMRMTMMG
ncbi:hypothetical protein X975_06767, partial [Stegodyphus mimosarum]